MNTKKIKNWQARINEIKKSLLLLEEMRPGSLSEQYNVCGNSRCRCKHPKNPRKHGPYFQLSYTHKGKSTTEFVKKEELAALKVQLENYRTFKRLIEEWIDLAVKIAKQRKQESGR